MTNSQRILRNTVALLLGHATTALAGIATAVLIARFLGDVQFGRYAFAVAFSALFSVCMTLGYETLLIREVARDKSAAKSFISNTAGLLIVSALATYCVLVMVIHAMGYPEETRNVVYLIGLSFVLTSVASVYRVSFRAFEKMQYEFRTLLIRNILRLCGVLAVLLLGYGIVAVATVSIGAAAIDLMVSWWLCRSRIVKAGVSLNSSFVRSTILKALPLALLPFFGLVYGRTDTVMLSVMSGDAVAGWYSAANNVSTALKPIAQLFLNALLPVMSIAYITSLGSLGRIAQRATRYLFILGLGCSVTLSVLAPQVAQLLYGPAFAQASVALRILAWDVLLTFVYTPLGFALVAGNRQTKMATAAGLAAGLNLALNLALIPHYAHVGAAIATVATKVILLAAYAWLSRDMLNAVRLSRAILSPLAAAGLVAIAYGLLSSINVVLLAGLGLAAYLVLTVLGGGVTREDLGLLRNALDTSATGAGPKSQRREPESDLSERDD